MSEENSMKTNYPLVEQVFGSKTRIRILKALAINEELTISLIIKETKTNHTSAIKHLNYLIDLGLVQKKMFGRIAIYRYKVENIRARSLAKFIKIWESDIE